MKVIRATSLLSSLFLVVVLLMLVVPIASENADDAPITVAPPKKQTSLSVSLLGGMYTPPIATSTPDRLSPDEIAQGVYSYIPPTPVTLPTPTPLPSPTPVPSPTPAKETTLTQQLALIRPAAERENAVYANIGFHLGAGGGNANGLSDWMHQLDSRGIPFFLKSASTSAGLYDAQELAKKSGVPHTLVYRRANGPFELPDYSLSPQDAAREHWDRHVSAFPPELDPTIVWMETINEPDQMRSDWLGWFALHTAELAVRDGRRWAAFGWSSGEPELADWARPGMLAFLQFAGQHPDMIAVALHEYSYTTDSIWREYPHLVGRFQQLFWVCDEVGIERPTVLITEWGWEYRNVPSPAVAMRHIDEAAKLYALYPEVRGAAIWYLGPNFGDIDTQTQKLIAPLASYTTSSPMLPPTEKTTINPRLFDQDSQ